MMKIILLLLFLSTNVFGHGHWIIPVSRVGQEIKVVIGSGHHFPNSEISLSDRIIHTFFVRTSLGKEIPLRSDIKKDRRVAKYTAALNGSYIFGFELRRPGMDESIFFGKTIVGNKYDATFILGHGLEIALHAPPVLGKDLSLSILLDGKQVAGRISILRHGGRALKLSTSKIRTAIYNVKKAGSYLLSTSYKGKESTLTFVVKESTIE